MDLHDLIKAGAVSRKARDFRTAVGLYLNALEIDPFQTQALKGLADAYRGLGETDRCLETWDRYLALWPGDGSVQTRVGDACRRTGKGKRALTHYLAACRHNPSDRYALMGLGDLHQKERRLDAALECWERLLGIDPGLLNIRTMAGNICRQKHDFVRAEHHFREALSIDPGNAHATFGLADTLRGLGQFEAAAPYWERILQTDSSNLQVLCRAGDCFARMGQLVRAEALFLRALQPGYDRSAWLGLARVYMLKGEHPEAIRSYETILARNPADSRTMLLLAQARESAPTPPQS